MTKQEIFNYFYTNSANLGINKMILTMLGGLVIGLIIYITYKESNKGVSYNQEFNAMLVLVLEIAIVIMLMISSNIVISLGMVGALSIVRFRTAIKNPRDTMFLFWAISEGLSVGSGNFKLALVTTIIIAITTMIFSFTLKKSNKYLVIITGEKEKIETEKVLEELKSISKYVKLRSANKNENHQEYIYEIKAKKEIEEDLLDNMMKIKGLKTINYIMESGENVG